MTAAANYELTEATCRTTRHLQAFYLEFEGIFRVLEAIAACTAELVRPGDEFRYAGASR
jgi:hypothetical protein